MDKSLQLIFEYNKAPDTLKAAAKTHRENSTKLAKAEEAYKKAQADLHSSQKAVAESSKLFNSELEAWTPTGA